MTMGEKLTALRKGAGWSQEDLSERLDVSRQSISKWEGDLAVPTVDKLLELSRLFAVSTDYLLKDELEAPEGALSEEDGPALRQVTLAEAEAFLALKKAGAKPTALAVTLCILSPVCLILLGGLSAIRPVRENFAVAAGLVVLFALVVPAVAIFVRWGMRLEKYEYLEKEIFAAAPGVTALAREVMEGQQESHSRRLVAGVSLCVASAVPLLACMAAPEHEFLLSCGVGLLLVLVAAGVYLIITASIPWGACQMLLQEGDYAPEQKSPLLRTVWVIYWCTVTAIYLGWSFTTRRWDETWIVWPVAGVLFGAVSAALRLVHRQRKK